MYNISMSSIFELFSNESVIIFFKFIYYTSPVWLLFILSIIFSNLWMSYVRAKFFSSLEYVLLEIKLPREIFKSPTAMEFLFNALYQTGGEDRKFKIKWKPFKITNEYYLEGKTRPWYSFEICAIDGKVRFFIWSRKSFRNIIEAQLYSQFPGIEIYEVPDYTLPINLDSQKISMWGTEFELTKPDPYPIKTYIDYGMEKDPKEEYKIDPMTPLIEFLASLGEKHNVWIQIIARAHTAESKDPVTGKMVDSIWSNPAKDEIKKILETAKPPKDDKNPDSKTAPPRPLTEGENLAIKALERSVSKPGFDVGIRAIYFAEKDLFNKANSAGIVAGFKHFNSNLNGFKGTRSPKDGDLSQMAHFLDSYKHRGYFYNEFKKPHFVLNTEELATIYHLPSISGVSAFERIGSKKAEAPVNLPI